MGMHTQRKSMGTGKGVSKGQQLGKLAGRLDVQKRKRKSRRLFGPTRQALRSRHRRTDHRLPSPAIACHRLNVLFALQNELAQACEAPWASIWLAAVWRYLATPLRRHYGLRHAQQALQFVASEN